MSRDWFSDMRDMHRKFGVRDWVLAAVERGDKPLLQKYIAFRLLMINEELAETFSAAMVQENPEEVVDGLIDLCVFAIGTLELLGVDAHKARDEVYAANISKSIGVKEGRTNTFGLPDLVKSETWQPPSHESNHGDLSAIFGMNEEVI